MNILICGANGFVGRHLSEALQAMGHQVLKGVRYPQSEKEVAIDYDHDISEADWIPKLEKAIQVSGQIDVLINAVGILNESYQGQFSAIHAQAPKALFQASQNLGIRKVIQISALDGQHLDGRVIEEKEWTPYMRTKREADIFLTEHAAHTHMRYLILRPSVIVGLDGSSSQFFRAMASLPILSLPNGGAQRMQAVHIDDIAQAVLNWVADENSVSQMINAVGPEEITYRDMLCCYRRHMNLPNTIAIPVPNAVMKATAYIAEFFPQKVLHRDTLKMLNTHNVASKENFEALIKRPAIAKENWFKQVPAMALRASAIHFWLLPFMMIVLATIWISSGVMSLWNWPVSTQLALELGVSADAAQMLVYAGSILDITLGVWMLVARGASARYGYICQLWVVILYSMVVFCFAPHWYLHPYGPMVKNMAVIVLTIYMLSHAEVSSRKHRL